MQESKTIIMQHGTIELQLLETGDIKRILSQGIMANQLPGNYLDGMAANIFLRIKEGGSYQVFPLMGKASQSEFAVCNNQVVYRGTAQSLSYTLYLTLVENAWFFDIFVENHDKALEIDFIYGQDIGLGTPSHIDANPAYCSQYIDHKVFETTEGYVVCSRQNQKQPVGFPFLQQGCLHKAVSFSTDGYPFFGTSYKFDNQIIELQATQLNNRIYQFEFAYTALQSAPQLVTDKTHITFYGHLLPNTGTIEKSVPVEDIRQMHQKVSFATPAQYKHFQYDLNINNTYTSQPFAQEELDALYPEKRHVETHDGKLLSFFTPSNEHVVLMDKELLVERPQGNIIITGNNDIVKEDLLSSTNYMYGVFNAQVVVGNTTFNKFNTNTYNGLNVFKSSGQRIMVRLDGTYKLLCMPAVFEMGFNYAKWFYKLADDVLEVTSYTLLDAPRLIFEIKSQRGKKYDFIFLSRTGDYKAMITYKQQGHDVVAKPCKDSLTAQTYENLEFVLHFDTDFELHDDSIFYPEMGTMHEPMMVLKMNSKQSFAFNMEARIDGKPVPDAKGGFAEEVCAYRNWLKAGIQDFTLSIADKKDNAAIKSEVERFNDISLWYSHNARVHYASPHGLEQYGGAAWGTRDVCQGPFEFFLATENFAATKDILEKVYTHQFLEDGSWPQWFMFDKYYKIQADESHGDVIVWPLKMIAAYLLATENYEFLDVSVPYMKREGFTFTNETETIYQHVKKEIAYITDHLIKGTSLSCYGDGDWDDTLQPANPALREKMVSGWTVALTYQAFSALAEVLAGYDKAYADELKNFATKIKEDYHKYMIIDGIVTGFAITEEDGFRYLLHPRDTETGLKYRLLPMTRAMIAEMFTEEEVASHFALIKQHLYHHDGVRLMDTTCRYRGGVNTYFMRAETSACFGREVSLLYVHAHIRFVEAMAKIGNADEAWLGLLKVNPIAINSVVKNATIRQSNCYFTSSDGMFDNRYEAMKDFDKLRNGDVSVKSGWRIYSSGPGIYLNQLIANCLGLRIQGKNVIFDPVLPKSLDGLSFSYKITGKPVCIHYHIAEGAGVSKILINNEEVPFTKETQPYRNAGVKIEAARIHSNCIIDLYL